MTDFTHVSGGMLAPAAKRIPFALRKAAGSTPQTAPRMRVALILYRDDLNLGGSLRVVEMLANALDPGRVETHVVFTYGGPGPLAKRSKVPCHFLESRGPRDVRSWLRARSIIDKVDPDILHFHNPAYWLHIALMGKPYKKLMHLHGPYFPRTMRAFERWLMAQTGRLAAGTVCITRDMRQMVLRLGWGLPDRTWTVYNGIDCAAPETAPRKHEARSALNLPNDALVIGVVCRLAWYKGCRDAIRILTRLYPDWHMLFCGDGPMRDYLLDTARQEGVADRTHFAGTLDDMRPGYAAMDAFLFLSRLEPFGLVIAEAMAAQVPVFGLAAEGAYRDALYPLITPNNSIFLERANPGDYISPEPAGVIDELARRINEFGVDPKSHRPMIERAREWVLDRFDARVQAEAMLELYEFVLRRPVDAPK
jgi:glycosyltransferase involved in cell wall biosynthesis